MQARAPFVSSTTLANIKTCKEKKKQCDSIFKQHEPHVHRPIHTKVTSSALSMYRNRWKEEVWKMSLHGLCQSHIPKVLFYLSPAKCEKMPGEVNICANASRVFKQLFNLTESTCCSELPSRKWHIWTSTINLDIHFQPFLHTVNAIFLCTTQCHQ